MNTNTDTRKSPRQNMGTGSYIAGLLMSIIGGCFMVGFGIPLIISIFEYMEVAAIVTFLVFFVIGCVMLTTGVKKCRLYNFSLRVRSLMRGKSRERLTVLAQAGKRRDYTNLVAELRTLSAKGVFPGSYVDLNRREFVLVPGGPQPPIVQGNTQLREKKRKSTAPIYTIALVFLVYALFFPLYRVTDFVIVTCLALIGCILVSRIFPERTVIVEEARRVEPPKPPEKINTGNEDLDEVLSTAMEYMNELTALDIAITNERIDKPLQEMVHICKQIFDYVQKSPKKVRQIRQFMNYYLPTTIQLLKTYDELSREPVKGENIKSTMTKIEDTMQTILQAFQKELDDLYKDKAMDISVDIEVLKNMMEQEGLGGGTLRLDLDKPGEERQESAPSQE